MKNTRWFLRPVSTLTAQPIFSFIAFLLTVLSLAVTFVRPVSAAEPAQNLTSSQYASNGQKFEELAALSPEEMWKLPAKIQMELEKWMDETEKRTKQTVESLDKGIEDGKKTVESKTVVKWEIDKTVESLDKGIEDGKKTIIAQYKKMIFNFTQLHAHKSQAPIYFTIKEDLKKVLLSGKPPEIIPELEKIRDILISEETSPRK